MRTVFNILAISLLINAAFHFSNAYANYEAQSEIAIKSPAHNEGVRANNGDVSIDVDVDPKWLEYIEVLVDGNIVEKVVTGDHNIVVNLDRGTHTLQLRLNKTTSEIITIHVLRVSVHSIKGN